MPLKYAFKGCTEGTQSIMAPLVLFSAGGFRENPHPQMSKVCTADIGVVSFQNFGMADISLSVSLQGSY